jgi:serine/threonine protein kinase
MAGPADDKPSSPNATPKGMPRPGATTPAKASQRPGPKALIGITISDRYRIERLLGEGGMGAVYQAEHTLMRKRMAIKVLHPEMTRLPEVVARFEREAMAAAHIDHPHVVTATDFGKLEDGSFFLALEYVEGKSLRELIGQGRLELGRALHIARQIAAALGRAHQLKIVHRDLKPENVMLVVRDGDSDFVKVLDFGIAKVPMGEFGENGSGSPGHPILTQAGMVYGTPEYMAPEQALGQPVDSRADLYALGCIMYEMLTGLRPFDAESKVALLGMQVTAPVPPMATKAPDASIPPEVEALVKQLLAKEASERVADAKIVIDGITTILGQLVANGRIDSGYAPPPASRLGTNPAIISGIGPAVDLPTSPPAVVGGVGRPRSPWNKLETLLGNKSWLVAAGGGLAGILVLVFTIVVVLRGEGPKADDVEAGVKPAALEAGAPEPVETSTSDQKIKEAISQIDKGNYGSGIDALTSLPEAQGREDVHRALIKAYSQTNRPKEAMREVGAVMTVNPNVKLLEPDGISLRTEVRDTALQEGQPAADKAAVDEAFGLFVNGRFGSIGLDDLYDIAYGRAGVNYPKAARRAQGEVARVDRTKMSQPLAVTVDLHVASGANNCGAIKSLLDRAVEKGDERTLLHLRTLVARKMVPTGHWNRMGDAYGCIHEGSLTRAINELEAKLKRGGR